MHYDAMYYDRDRRPIDEDRFLTLRADSDYRRVCVSTLIDGTQVSTVWLGYNMGYNLGGPPLIFETAVFTSRDVLLDDEMYRWPTEAAARAGHDQVVATITEALERLRAAVSDVDVRLFGGGGGGGD